MAGAGIGAGTGVGLSARGNAASGCSGVSLSWFGWVPGPVSFEKVVLGSVFTGLSGLQG